MTEAVKDGITVNLVYDGRAAKAVSYTHLDVYKRQEKNNPALKGALPDNYYSRLHIDTAKLASLLDEINQMCIRDRIRTGWLTG